MNSKRGGMGKSLTVSSLATDIGMLDLPDYSCFRYPTGRVPRATWNGGCFFAFPDRGELQGLPLDLEPGWLSLHCLCGLCGFHCFCCYQLPAGHHCQLLPPLEQGKWGWGDVVSWPDPSCSCIVHSQGRERGQGLSCSGKTRKLVFPPLCCFPEPSSSPAGSIRLPSIHLSACLETGPVGIGRLKCALYNSVCAGNSQTSPEKWQKHMLRPPFILCFLFFAPA